MNLVEAWRYSWMDKDDAEEWQAFLADAEDAERADGEAREPGAPAWWHGEDDAAAGMLAMMGRPSSPGA